MIAISLHPTLSEVPLPIPCSFALVNFSAPGFRRNGTILSLRSIRHLSNPFEPASRVNIDARWNKIRIIEAGRHHADFFRKICMFTVSWGPQREQSEERAALLAPLSG